MTGPVRLLAVAESDSYLKWGAALLEQAAGALPPGGTYEVVVPFSPIRPSAAQRAAALAGTSFAGQDPPVLTATALRRRVERDRPDAVLLACTGPTALALQEELARASHRPVLLAGIPGIAVPARREAWDYRAAIDLMVVHSRREVGEYDRLRAALGRPARVGLARLPFLPERADASAVPGGTAVVFATQGKVPADREQRVAVLRSLARLARNRPELSVLVKTRGVPGEFHTHYEAHHYQDLWRHLVDTGEFDGGELTFAAGSMAVHLKGAAALVTVSSTAALEAIAMAVPLLLVDEFGVDDALINQVFLGSGCLAGLESLEKGEFRDPDPEWLADNYFHPDDECTWAADLQELVSRGRVGELAPLAAGLAGTTRSASRRRRGRLRLTPVGSELARMRRRWREARLR